MADSPLMQAARPLVAQAEARRRAGWVAAQKRAQAFRNAPAGGKVRHGGSMSIQDYVRGCAAEGAEAMEPRSGCMRDMVKRFPWMGDPHDQFQPEFKATSFFRDGKWWRRGPDGDWIAEDPPRRDWSK